MQQMSDVRYQCFSFTIAVGGFGGFFASVRDIGVRGQQQQQSQVSAEEEVLGGGGGSFLSAGGATNPVSSEPSPANIVPAHKVTDNAVPAKYFSLFLINVTPNMITPRTSYFHAQ
jgi:hypothetical protein